MFIELAGGAELLNLAEVREVRVKKLDDCGDIRYSVEAVDSFNVSRVVEWYESRDDAVNRWFNIFCKMSEAGLVLDV